MLCGSRCALLACCLVWSAAGCGRARYSAVDAGPDAYEITMPDAPAPRDAGPDAGSARDEICGRATTLSCLDFEADPPAPWGVFRSPTATAPSYEVRPEFRGRALQVRLSTTGSYTGVRFPITEPELIRSGLYISYAMHLHREATTGYVVVGELNGMRFGTFSKISVDSNAVGLYQIAATGGGGGPVGSFPEDRWVCVRLEVSSTRARAEVDGVMTEITPPSDVGNFEWVAIGVATQRDTIDAHYDDVIISTAPVSCLPM